MDKKKIFIIGDYASVQDYDKVVKQLCEIFGNEQYSYIVFVASDYKNTYWRVKALVRQILGSDLHIIVPIFPAVEESNILQLAKGILDAYGYRKFIYYPDLSKE